MINNYFVGAQWYIWQIGGQKLVKGMCKGTQFRRRGWNKLLETKGKIKQTPWLFVRKRTIPIERRPFVGEVSANVCG
jgi:hypothetical protein